MDLAEVKSTALHLSWWVGRSQGKPQEKDGGCVATTWGPLVGKIFFGCFIHQNNTPPDSIPQENWQLFFSENFLNTTNPLGGFAPQWIPQSLCPQKHLGGFTVCFQNNSFKGRKLGSGGHFFFFTKPPKNGTITADLWGMYGMYIPFFMNLSCKVYTRWLQTPMVIS